MIFVTVGSFRFDELVRTVDSAVAEGRIGEKVIVQIGGGTYTPKHCEYFRTAKTLSRYYEEAELIVAHGGTGSTLEALRRGVRLVSVSNPALKENHQRQLLEALEKLGYVHYCRDLTQVPDYIEKVRRIPPRPLKIESLFINVIRSLEDFRPRSGRRRSSVMKACLSRWLNYVRAPRNAVEVVQVTKVQSKDA